MAVCDYLRDISPSLTTFLKYSPHLCQQFTIISPLPCCNVSLFPSCWLSLSSIHDLLFLTWYSTGLCEANTLLQPQFGQYDNFISQASSHWSVWGEHIFIKLSESEASIGIHLKLKEKKQPLPIDLSPVKLKAYCFWWPFLSPHGISLREWWQSRWKHNWEVNTNTFLMV